jgi:hypothetical protein
MVFHNLRDTCGTHMAIRCDPPQHVQSRLGHSTPAMGEAYIANARYQAGTTFGEPLPPLPCDLYGGDESADVIVPDSRREAPVFQACVVGQPGLEPETNGLRVHCSTN